MANHVYQDVIVRSIDSGASLDTLVRDSNGEFLEPEHMVFMKDCGQEWDEDGNLNNWYQWGCDNVGAKWCHIEDAGEDFLYLNSAWSPAMGLVEKLTKHLAQADENIEVEHQYTDEFYNFIGVAKYTFDADDGEVIVDYQEIDWDVIAQYFIDKYTVDPRNEDFDWDKPLGEDKECPYEVQAEFIENWRREAYDSI